MWLKTKKKKKTNRKGKERKEEGKEKKGERKRQLLSRCPWFNGRHEMVTKIEYYYKYYVQDVWGECKKS